MALGRRAATAGAVVALFKRTGDWQRFSGDTSPSGVLPQPEKANKTDAFNAALAEAGKEPRAAPSKPAKEGSIKPEAPRRGGQSLRAVRGGSTGCQRGCR